MPNKHEFRFVVNGIELSAEQQQKIGNAVVDGEVQKVVGIQVE